VWEEKGKEALKQRWEESLGQVSVPVGHVWQLGAQQMSALPQFCLFSATSDTSRKTETKPKSSDESDP